MLIKKLFTFENFNMIVHGWQFGVDQVGCLAKKKNRVDLHVESTGLHKSKNVILSV